MREERIRSIPTANILERSETRSVLPIEQMGNLLSAVGNHEAKSITLILIRDGDIYNRAKLLGKVLNAQRKNTGWIMSDTTAYNYCSHSFAPNGLAIEVVSNENLITFGYSITESGRALGIPFAGLLLDFSQRHNISLNSLFGSNISISRQKTIQIKEGEDIEFQKRSSLTTLEILYELFTSSSLPIRQSDLAKRISECMNVVSQNLNRLSKSELIQYKAVKINEPYSLYKLSSVIPEGELPIYLTSPTLTKSTFNILKSHPNQYLTREDIYNSLPAEDKNGRLKKSYLARITDILSFFCKHQYVTTTGFHYDKQSEINITDEQKAVLAEFLGIMYRFQNQDKEILEKGRRLAEEIILNPDKVSSLLYRAKEASSHANASSQEETQKNILSIISSNPGITNKEIQRHLEMEYKKKLQINRIRSLSSNLVKQEFVVFEKEGSLNRFYPNS